MQRRRDDDVTQLLSRWGAGDRSALEHLLPVVYDELRRLARSHLRVRSEHVTLQPTVLVHEVYLKLLAQRHVHLENRAHFYGAAAQIMRRLIVDHARERSARKRGGAATIAPLDEAMGVEAPQDVDVMALHEALDAFEAVDPAKARLVELRYFAGLSIQQVADVTGRSATSVKRDWAIARAWLFDRLGRG